ncbi:MAG TPA: hypothetical protein V6D08_08215 [Candidatus Obscuribacterales bacterium]
MEKTEGLGLNCKDVATRWEHVDSKIQSYWHYGADSLEAARPALRERMLRLDAEFTASATFSKMPPIDGCQYLWMLFLKDGAPGTDDWCKKWTEESGVRRLGLRDLFVVLASIELEAGAQALLEHAYLRNKGGEVEEAITRLIHADAHIASAEKALQFVDEHPVYDLPRTCLLN